MPHPIVRTVSLALCLSAIAPVAAAQRAPVRRTAPSAAPVADAGTGIQMHVDAVGNPGSFSAPSAQTSANVGTGAAAAPTNGPSTQLRGAGGPTPDEITGPIGPGDAARIVRAHMPQLRPCYERARERVPTLQGRVELRFTITRGGTVTRAQASSLAEAPEMATCLADVLRQTRFPEPEGGLLTVVYPVTFMPETPPARLRGRARAGARTRAATPAAGARATTSPSPRR